MASARRSRPGSYRPPAEFGQQAIRLAESLGKTPDDVMRAIPGYESKKTLDRLARGEGSLEFALALRDQLEEWGADVAALRLPGVDRGSPTTDPWEREWLQLGRRLRALASDEKLAEVDSALRDLIESYEKIAVGSGMFSRRRD